MKVISQTHVINYYLLLWNTYGGSLKFIREVYLKTLETDFGAYYVGKRSTTHTDLISFPTHKTSFNGTTLIYEHLHFVWNTFLYRFSK